MHYFAGLCTGKSQTVYETMLQGVIDACDHIGVSANPTSVTTDFESAAMNAVRKVRQQRDNPRVFFTYVRAPTESYRRLD